jgi:hypothetical protein
MNHVTRQFQQRLAAFRDMDDKRRSTVCDVMKISQKTHLRLLAEIRKETGTLTKAERFREIVAMVRDWLGDGDPKAISLVAGAKALGVSTNQVARARDAIMRERLDGIDAPRLALMAKPEPKLKSARRWHDGAELRWWPKPAGKRRVRLVVTEENHFEFAEVGT